MCILGEFKVRNVVSLKLNKEFRRAYKKGKSAAGPSMVIYAYGSKGRTSRLGLTVSTKIGKAVIRNKIRRRLREIYRTNREMIKDGYDIVIVARHRSRSAGYRELEEEFKRIAEKLGILKEPEPAPEARYEE